MKEHQSELEKSKNEMKELIHSKGDIRNEKKNSFQIQSLKLEGTQTTQTQQ